MNIVSFQDAIAAGSTRYFTGSPCPRGHIAERRTVNRSCVACNAEKQKQRYTESLSTDPQQIAGSRRRAKQWAADHPEAYAARQKAYREANREKLRAYRQQYGSENKERIAKQKADKRAFQPEIERLRGARRRKNPAYAASANARSKAWRENNRDAYNTNVRLWKQNNPERAKAIARAGSINRRAKMRALEKLSALDVKLVRSAKNCAICGQIHEKMEIDHVIAISRGGRNHVSNLQLLCRPCNRSKWAKDLSAWLEEKGLTKQQNY